MSGRLLVIAHEGYRNGATVVLRHVLPPVIAALDVPTQVEVQTGGPLGAVLRGLATETSLDARPGLVLVNSALAAGALVERDPELPSVVWVHEEGEALRSLPGPALEGLRARARRVLCVSEAARRDLEALGVAPERLALLRPPISIATPSQVDVAAVRAELVSNPTERLILACGEATWRKGADLFVAVAAATRDPRLRFGWLGRRSRGFAKQLDHDTRMAGLVDRVSWLGEVDDPAAHLAAADLLVLTSREDPQPLVPLEAAVLGTATAGFAGTGFDELVAVRGAASVAYPDVDALAGLITELVGDADGCARLVEAAQSLVWEQRSLDRIVAELVSELRIARAGDIPPTHSEHP